MSSAPPPPRPPWVIPLIIFVLDVLIFGFLGMIGALPKLPSAVQFFLGASTVAFPLIIYVLLKARADRGEDS